MTGKILALAAVASILFFSTHAQNIPDYVPKNGLVGWWPFNGNANDESGNGNNGTVNGATLTTDRLGNVGKAYSFDGISKYISLSGTSDIDFSQGLSFAAWFNSNDIRMASIIDKETSSPIIGYRLNIRNNADLWAEHGSYGVSLAGAAIAIATNAYKVNTWIFVVGTLNPITNKNSIYVNGTLLNSENISTLISNNKTIEVGKSTLPQGEYFNGKIDDIAIYNRALSQQEITNLYNAVNCSYNLTISPSSIQLQTTSTANFTATTSDSNPSYVWQSDFGQGFQTLNNFGNYSGVNTGTLNISNVQLSNHNQPFRVIATSGNCVDTSSVALIKISDTCLLKVTDTLVINTVISNLTSPNNENTIKIYPNPTSGQIVIDYGIFTRMNGYTIRINNSVGQQVFSSLINKQQSTVNISSLGSKGIYFVQIIDPQSKVIDTRKIVLQ
jgi:hypothetical protein